jgi:hypothetical protein
MLALYRERWGLAIAYPGDNDFGESKDDAPESGPRKGEVESRAISLRPILIFLISVR